MIRKFTAAHLFITVSASEINRPTFQALQHEPHSSPSLKDFSCLKYRTPVRRFSSHLSHASTWHVA